jgi:aldehyde dehydrogenase (NAD+)
VGDRQFQMGDVTFYGVKLCEPCKPLAMYIFSERQQVIDEVLLNSSSGGVTVNGMMLHYVKKNLPFGGCNTSGIGRCKGDSWFRELSNGRSIFIAREKT